MVQFLRSHSLSRNLIYKLGEPRGRFFIKHLEPYLSPADSIVDIGAGIGNISAQLGKKGYHVLALDIEDLSFTSGVNPILYNGRKMPFKNKEFDVSIIITVLHHVKTPEAVISEARRVSSKIIIIEDIYFNVLHKYLTFLLDSMLNLEFRNHPHSNKNDANWKRLFKKMGLKLSDTKYDRSFLLFKHVVYVLET